MIIFYSLFFSYILINAFVHKYYKFRSGLYKSASMRLGVNKIDSQKLWNKGNFYKKISENFIIGSSVIYTIIYSILLLTFPAAMGEVQYIRNSNTQIGMNAVHILSFAMFVATNITLTIVGICMSFSKNGWARKSISIKLRKPKLIEFDHIKLINEIRNSLINDIISKETSIISKNWNSRL